MALTDTGPKRTAAFAAAVLALATPLVMHYEGRVLKTYPDVVHGWNVPTACDGHTGPELHKGQTFTQAQCDEMLHRDLTKEYDALDACMPLDVSPPELAAYLDLAHNDGPGAVCRSSIPRKLTAGDHRAACATITDFENVRINGVLRSCTDPALDCMGIVHRRAAERSLCESMP
jgi:lysozyme